VKTTIKVVLDQKEVFDAIIEAARGQAGNGAGSATVKIDAPAPGEVTGAVVEFSRGK
jgi:hypothetical protein